MVPTVEQREDQDQEVLESDLVGEAFEEIVEAISEIDDVKELCDYTYSALEGMLRRKSDRELLVALSESVGEIIGGLPFDAPPDALKQAVRAAARSCIGVLQTAREKRVPRPCSEPESRPDDIVAAPSDDAFYYLPAHLSHLLRRLEYTSPALAEPAAGFGTFQQLYEAAILYRIDSALVFFHKNRAETLRELPRPFVLSPTFAENLKTAIERLIFPAIGNSHQMRILAPGVDWTHIDVKSFWTDDNTRLVRRKILQIWHRAWDDLKLISSAGSDGLNVVQVKESTKLLRELLAPSPPHAYDIPRVTNRELHLFEGMLELPEDWVASMEGIWRRCQDLYEQEKDTRVFQQKAREGALRDGILAASKEFSEEWGDFLVLLCHYVFPRISTVFLEHFSASLGTSEAYRERRMPYLMRYLRQARTHPGIKARELREEEELKSQTDELRNFLKGRTQEVVE